MATGRHSEMMMRYFNTDCFDKVRNVLVLVMLMVVLSCDRDLSDDQIPFASFGTISINLNLPEYQKLRTSGNTYINSGGVRGIILYQANPTTFIAYERNCSYRPNEACSTVEVHASNLYMFDPCCNSTFDFATGTPTSGAAWRPLRTYETQLSGSILTITDRVIEN
ncbi:hypothetical protein [Chryseosolibacter indicus]|uniref:Rieske domain-containing protein n=1 Tax=Chryseosolibacter indicus TaxID=2782351 RepID=A0ABS5VUJ9_9BACT|nr:hypothetical protein [Chryseosolibacter indicus]MBT1704564.1 hypothetical protein [Chryseosolibacter indicus]